VQPNHLTLENVLPVTIDHDGSRCRENAEFFQPSITVNHFASRCHRQSIDTNGPGRLAADTSPIVDAEFAVLSFIDHG